MAIPGRSRGCAPARWEARAARERGEVARVTSLRSAFFSLPTSSREPGPRIHFRHQKGVNAFTANNPIEPPPHALACAALCFGAKQSTRLDLVQTPRCHANLHHAQAHHRPGHAGARPMHGHCVQFVAKSRAISSLNHLVKTLSASRSEIARARASPHGAHPRHHLPHRARPGAPRARLRLRQGARARRVSLGASCSALDRANMNP